MGHNKVAGARGVFKICRIAANMLNKKSQQETNNGSSL
jgi:hypothetical protein